METQKTVNSQNHPEEQNCPPALLRGMYIGAAAMEDSMEVLQKAKNRTIIWFSNSTPGCLSKENENIKSKLCMSPYAHCSTVYNSQGIEAN